MAVNYTICVSTVAQTTSVTMTNPSTCTSRTYTIGDCTIREDSKTLTFNATLPSDGAYTIWYSWDITYEENGVNQGTDTMNGFVLMPAGATQVTVEVLCYKRSECASDSGDSGDFEPLTRDSI